MFAKDPYEPKYQFLINKRESTRLKHDDSNAFIEYSNDMYDVYKIIDEYNSSKRKLLIIFDDMIADMINNKKLNSIVTELFIRGRKLNISIVFITQSYFEVPKDVTLNRTQFFITKNPNKRELQGIALNHSSNIDLKKFMNIYKECTKEPYSFLVNDTNLPSDNLLRIRKNLWNKKNIIKIMTIDDKIRDDRNYDMKSMEKLQKYLPETLGTSYKYGYLTAAEIIPLDQKQLIEQIKFQYDPLGEALEKQT